MESKRFAETNGDGGGAGGEDDEVTDTDAGDRDGDAEEEAAAAAAATRNDRERSSENECRVGADGRRQCSATPRQSGGGGGTCDGKPSWVRRIALGLLAAAVVGGIAWTIYSHWFAKPIPAPTTPAPRPLLSSSGPTPTPAPKVSGAATLPASAPPAHRRPLASRAPRRVAFALPNETSAESNASPDEDGDDDDDDDGSRLATTESKSRPTPGGSATTPPLSSSSQMATARGRGGRLGAREPVAASSGNRATGGPIDSAATTTTTADQPTSVCVTCAQCRHQATYDVRDMVEFARRQNDVRSAKSGAAAAVAAKKRDPKRLSTGADTGVADAAHADRRTAPTAVRAPAVTSLPPPASVNPGARPTSPQKTRPHRRPERGSIAGVPEAAPAHDTGATVAARDQGRDEGERAAETSEKELPSAEAANAKSHASKVAEDEEQSGDDGDGDGDVKVTSPAPPPSSPPSPPEEVKLSVDETKAVVRQKLTERLPDYASATMENITAFSRELFAQRHRLAKLPDAEALAIVKAHVAPWGLVDSKVALALMWKCKSNLADEFKRQLAYDEAVAKIRLEKLRLAKLQEA